MTLVLAFPATDGVALLTDTRKWLPGGRYVDGHQKLVRCWDGLLTGSGSGDLLDFVAERSSCRLGMEVLLLIHQVAASAPAGLQAEWTLSVERAPKAGDSGAHGIAFQVFDGRHLRPNSWVPGNLPCGLFDEQVERITRSVRSFYEQPRSLDEVRSVALALYRDIHRSGLVSREFDFGTHRPGKCISIERLEVPRRRPIAPTRCAGVGAMGTATVTR